MSSLARRQAEVLQTLQAIPRQQGIHIGVTFGIGESMFEVTVKARTFESLLSHAGEMTAAELADAVDKLIVLAQSEPSGSSPIFRLVEASVN